MEGCTRTGHQLISTNELPVGYGLLVIPSFGSSDANSGGHGQEILFRLGSIFKFKNCIRLVQPLSLWTFLPPSAIVVADAPDKGRASPVAIQGAELFHQLVVKGFV